MSIMEQEQSLRQKFQDTLMQGIATLEDNAHRLVGAGAATLALANAGPAMAGTPAEQAGSQNAYTTAIPGDSLSAVQNNLLAGKGVVVKAARVNAGALQAEGDCAQGSTYSLWLDIPESLQQTNCDTTNSVAPQSALPSNRFQSAINTMGAKQVTSITGFSMDLRQPVIDTTADAAKTTINFVCPPATAKPSRTPSIAKVETLSNNTANLVFCASTKRNVQLTRPNPNHPAYAGAMAKYKADSLRRVEWGGNNLKDNLYVNCPHTLENQQPMTTFKYSKKSGLVSVGMGSLTFPKYCDEVGQYSQEVSAQVSKPGKSTFRDIGKKVLLVNGLREVLASDYGLPYKETRTKVSLSDVGNLCKSALKKGTRMRIKVSQRFTGDKSQTFIRPVDSPSAEVKSSTITRTSSAKKICK